MHWLSTIHSTETQNASSRPSAIRLRASGEVRALRLEPGHPVEVKGVDMFVVGCATQGWKLIPTIQSFLEYVSRERLRTLRVACFDTRFWLPRWMNGSAAKVRARKLREKGVPLLVEPECFFVKGTQGPLRDGELARAAAWVRTLIKEVEAPSPEARQ